MSRSFLEAELIQKYSHIPNLEIVGLAPRLKWYIIRHFSVLVLVNTAAREGLPNSFIEAAAHKTAILSSVNPDDFAFQFGYHVQDDDFAKGLKLLLKDNFWQQQAEKGYQYIQEIFSVNKVMNQHEGIYTRCFATKEEASKR